MVGGELGHVEVVGGRAPRRLIQLRESRRGTWHGATAFLCGRQESQRTSVPCLGGRLPPRRATVHSGQTTRQLGQSGANRARQCSRFLVPLRVQASNLCEGGTAGAVPSAVFVRGAPVPTGKVKWFNADKGFGFLAEDGGEDVFVHRDALPNGVTELKPGQRVEFGVVQGRKGNQALSVRVLDPVPSVVRATRKPPEEMAPLVEDLIKMLDQTSNLLRKGRYPDRGESRKIAALLRAFADNLDA